MVKKIGFATTHRSLPGLPPCLAIEAASLDQTGERARPAKRRMGLVAAKNSGNERWEGPRKVGRADAPDTAGS